MSKGDAALWSGNSSVSTGMVLGVNLRNERCYIKRMGKHTKNVSRARNASGVFLKLNRCLYSVIL